MKYPHIRHLSKLSKKTKDALFSDAYVFEKLDGGNVQVAVSESVVTFGTRSGKPKSNRAPWVEEFRKWYWKNSSSIDELPAGIYFGEFLAPHTIQYKPEFVNQFFLIDVYDPEKQEFLDYNSALERIRGKETIMRPAPLLHRRSITDEEVVQRRITDEEVVQLVNGRSEYSVGGEREGVVVKNYLLQTFAKAKRPEFMDNTSLTGKEAEA